MTCWKWGTGFIVETWAAFCWAANEVPGNTTRVMNCDEATLVLAWTPLDCGVREASISHLFDCLLTDVGYLCVFVCPCAGRYMASTLVPCLHECELCRSPIPTNLGSTERGHENGFVDSCIGLPPCSVYIPLWIYVKWRLYTLQRSICLGVGEAYDMNYVSPVYTILALLI